MTLYDELSGIAACVASSAAYIGNFDGLFIMIPMQLWIAYMIFIRRP